MNFSCKECYCKLMEYLNCLQNPFLLIIRLYWGWSFFQIGKGKLMNADSVVPFFAKLGIPFPEFSVYLVGTFETIGGLLLLTGLCARLASIPLVIILLVAYTTAHSSEFFAMFSDPKTFLAQTPFLFLYTTSIILLWGPGKFSVDYFLQKKCCKNDESCCS